MKKEVSTAENERQRALIRGAMALLYAHWEGFVKNAATFYLNYVSLRGLPYRDLAANFVGLAIKHRLDEAADSRKAAAYTSVAEMFRSSLQQRAKLPYDVVNTQSNLSTKVFTNILSMVGVSDLPYAGQQKPVIERLLYVRNNIAHGQPLIVGLEQFEQLHLSVINLLNLFRNDIQNAALLERFRQT